jgi:tryptophan 2,3-dioxygenase
VILMSSLLRNINPIFGDQETTELMHNAQIADYQEQIHSLKTKQDLYMELKELQRQKIDELKTTGKAFEADVEVYCMEREMIEAPLRQQVQEAEATTTEWPSNSQPLSATFKTRA